MTTRTRFPAALVAMACLSLAPLAQAAPILLDFDTAGTGLNLDSAPLVVSAGTITLTDGIVAANGHPTVGLESSQLGDDTRRTRLSFDFDVSSVTFDFSGEGGGNFLAEVLDINGAVLASYTFTGTGCASGCFDASGVVLAASGIRAFRFADSPGPSNIALVDNLVLETGAAASVPEPASFGLAALALAGLGAAMRRGRRRG